MKECEFTVKYDGYEDTLQVQFVKEWREKCVIIKLASLDEPGKRNEKYQLSLHHNFNSPILQLKRSSKKLDI